MQHFQHAILHRHILVRLGLGYRSRLRALVRAGQPVVVFVDRYLHRISHDRRKRIQSVLVNFIDGGRIIIIIIIIISVPVQLLD